MIEARIPDNEPERLAALGSYRILDTDPEQAFDDLTRFAAQLCATPISLVSLVDAERQWFKSRVGLDASETPRRVAYCSHAILKPDEVMVVPDAYRDERFADNPIATGEPFVRFYAGAPLVNPQGIALGTLCVIDHEPRELSDELREALKGLARQVVSQLELRRCAVELRTYARELQRANEELRDFTSMAAHDLREPLRKVISFGDLLRLDLGDELPEAAATDLSYMVDATQRMQNLLDDLLDLAQASHRPVARESLDLTDCAQEARDALAVRIQESGARVVVEPLPELRGDATLLTQLFQNLLSNALKFVQDTPPEVRVSAVERASEIEVVVEDNGIGMEPESAEQVFRPFRRLHGRDSFGGTGIGLAIAKKVVERHGGRIWVESTPGAGSRFHFVLRRPEKTQCVPVAEAVPVAGGVPEPDTVPAR